METLSVICLTYDLYKFIIENNNHLEKKWRYSLGNGLVDSVSDLLKEEILAKHAPKTLKSVYLLKAFSHLEITTLKLRILLEFKLIQETKIFQAQEKIAEIGRELGGWYKSSPTATRRCWNSDSQDRSCPSSPGNCRDSSRHRERCRM